MRVSLRLFQIGAIAVVVAVATYHAFELDRFFVAKELALHAAVVLAALFAWRGLRELEMARLDWLLVAFLGLGALSALFATNRWLGLRGLAVSVSAALVFWVARTHGRALAGGLSLAVVVAAITSLLQTYGLDIELFSENRIPGGTLGNRNFIAHVAAFGLPLLLYMTITARRRRTFFWNAIGTALVTGSLVITRSRAAWLAFAVMLIVFLFALTASPPLRRDGRTWRRLGLTIVLAAVVTGTVLALPNALHWRSKNPYLETMHRVADYQGGSGRGRLIQYERSLGLAIRHPLFGVGPGNWAVEYPTRAPANDPSMSESEPGTTENPWPSSDWVAFVSERGIAATILLGLFFLGVIRGAFGQLFSAPDADSAIAGAALLGVVAGALVSGLFDAVLLTAVPAYLVFGAIGALLSVAPAILPAKRSGNLLLLLALILVSTAGAYRSASQLVAMDVYTTARTRAQLEHGSQIDPGNYRLHLRLARGGKTRCFHAEAAHALYPSARTATQLARGCR
ncbi:MAG TPA: O-antigen ligase family protein [Thermoanaerobaculia bacterium]|nr:O-antigen ligase family protein [Thermoanaerobaculia bacterium]